MVVADPAQLKAIANARIKTDKVDAHILAQLLRLDFLPEVELPTRGTWALRQLIAHRQQLRRQSVAAKNTIHGVLNRSLERYPGKFLFHGEGLPLARAPRRTASAISLAAAATRNNAPAAAEGV